MAAYKGKFLDGFYLGDSAEFERWVEAERSRLAEKFSEALETLASTAENAGDYRGAVRSWRTLIDNDPLSTRNAAGLVRALMRAGEHAAALQYAEHHEALLARELGTTPGPAIAELIAQLRSQSNTNPVVGRTGLAIPAAPHALHAAARQDDQVRDAENSLSSRAVPHSMPPRRAAWYAAAVVLLTTTIAALTLSALSHGRETRISNRPALPDGRHGRTPNLAAYELYMHGSDPTLYRSDSGARAARAYFQRAIDLDPGYAAAYAGLAQMEIRLAGTQDTTMSLRERFRRGEQAALTAVALDDSSADAHAALSVVRKEEYQFGPAESELKRAVALEPSTARFHEWLVQLYVLMDRPSEAQMEARRALDIDPLSAPANAELAHAMLAAGRCDDALRQLAPLRLLQPPLLRAANFAAQGYACKGMWTECNWGNTTRLSRRRTRGTRVYGFLLARAGRTTEAQRILDEFLERSQKRGECCGRDCNGLRRAWQDGADDRLARPRARRAITRARGSPGHSQLASGGRTRPLHRFASRP